MERKLMLLLACLFMSIGLVTAQTQKVTGIVISEEDGQPVIGASVLVKGTQLGTITDVDGKFNLPNVPSSAKTLVVSYIGMQTQEVAIKPNVKVMMKSDTELIEEVVIVGYGTGKKLGSVVGSIGTVNNKKLEKNLTANFTDALAGQVSGLSVLSGSGDPSKTASIRLRGVTSINASTTPLFILDGAPVSSSVFNSLNPSDIENITVLKDAASTSIYGSRAANGVIVITSKKGRFEQKPTVTLRAQYGFSSMVEDQLEMMNASQYMQFREMLDQPLPQDAVDAITKYGIDTNWRDEIFDGSAPTYTLDASVRGGGSNNSYYLSVNHHDQEGIIDQSGLRRESVRFNFDTRIAKWLKIGLQSNLGYQKYETNNEIEANDGIYATNPAFFARKAMPYDSPYYYTIGENGNIVWGDKADYLHYSKMPTVDYINRTRDVKRRLITANLNLYQEITPIKGLTIRAQQALDAFDYRSSNVYFPTSDLNTPMGDTWKGDTGARSESFQRYYAWTYTNTAEYKFNIDAHNVTLLAGQESIINKNESFGVMSSGHTDSRQMLLQQGTTVSPSNLSQTLSETVVNSYFFTASYNYDQKYYFDAAFRRDGSSKFAPDHRWANFYSLGAMWDVKKESFLESVDWLNELSVKASYGTTGNSGIDDYAYFGLIGSGGKYNGLGSLGIAQASNYDLTWETVAAANVGLQFRMFDRFSVSADFYHKKTTDMLMEIPYSFTTGFSGGAGNIGSMVNKGVDLELNVDIFNTNDFRWSVKANFNYNKNEITELFNGRDEFTLPNYGLKYKVGHSVGELYFVRRFGVDPRDGKQIWLDKDGNKTKVFNEERDAVLLGKDRFAPYTGGFGTEASWKGITVSADFTWAWKKYLMNNDNYFLMNPSQALSINQTTDMLNMWTTPGQVTDIPAASEAIQFDDHLVEDASFLRLKNLTVQYSLPKSILKYVGMQNASVFFTGRNLLTFTKFTGYDPEPDINLVKFMYPNTRQYVFGFELTF